VAGDPTIGSNSSTVTLPPPGGHDIPQAKAAGATGKAVGAGQAANSPPPQPAAIEKAVKLPDPATQAADAKKLAEAGLKELQAAAQDVSELRSQHAAPAAISAAIIRLNVALEKAEQAAAANLKIHRESESNALASRESAESEVKTLESEVQRGNLTQFKPMQTAIDISIGAENKWNDSIQSVAEAEDLQKHSEKTIATLSSEAARQSYPNLEVADDAVRQARDELDSFIPNGVIHREQLANVGTAAANARAAWQSARDEANKGEDKLLQKGCEAGLREAERPLWEIVVGNHPNLPEAETDYSRARDGLFSAHAHLAIYPNPILDDEDLPLKDALENRNQLLAAYQEQHNIWEAARNDAARANDTVLRDFCDQQLKYLEHDVQQASKF
jgi:hypothetical protein